MPPIPNHVFLASRSLVSLLSIVVPKADQRDGVGGVIEVVKQERHFLRKLQIIPRS